MRSLSFSMLSGAILAMAIQGDVFAGGDGPCSYPLKPLPCNADLDLNGAVDVDDLLKVVGQWGLTSDDLRPAGDCAPLNNGDCTVNIEDLLMILDQFGSDTSECGPCGDRKSVV